MGFCGEFWTSVRNLRWYDWLIMVLMTFIPLAAGFGVGTTINTDIYKNNDIQKPDWAPPPWLFGPVWGILYPLTGFASFLVWKCGGGINETTLPPLILYTLQLIMNLAWTPIFFNYGKSAGGLVDISALWGLGIGCLVTFVPASKVASVLFLPYMVWISFATALNFSITCSNGCTLMINATQG